MTSKPRSEEQLSDVAEAQLVAETPEYGEQHDVRWVLQIVEGRAGPLVEPPPAGLAAEPPVAERGAALAPRRRRGCTVWTSHQRPYGVGTDTASALLVSAGDNPGRLRSEAAFAHLCGVAPIDASSGLTTRKRLNPVTAAQTTRFRG